MIIREFFRTREDGVNLFITKSDSGYKIRKVGTDYVYSEAVDVEGSAFEYKETDEKILTEEEIAQQEKIM